MRALVYRGKGKMVLESVPKPKVGPTDVLLKIRSVGICGTDLHIYNGGMATRSGLIPGHEFSGTVVARGRSVTGVRIGERVVAEHVLTCGVCYYCQRGQPNLCLSADVFGINCAGALAEFMAVPARLVYAIPRSLSFDEAALVEPLSIGVYAAGLAGPLLGKAVAVVGQGPIGLLLDQVLSAGGATVIGIDVLPDRLAFVQKKGWVALALNPKDRTFASKLKRLAPLGVDVSFEAVGREVTAAQCINLTRRAGSVFLLGVFEKPAVVDLMSVIKKELRVQGSWTCAFTFPPAIALAAARRIDLKSMITHVVPFEQAPQAFADASVYAGNRIKTVIRLPD